MRKGSILRHTLGLFCFPLIGLLVAIAWLNVTANLLGIGDEGFGSAAAIVVMPIWALLFGVCGWLPAWLLHAYRWGTMSGGRALGLGALAGLLVGLVLMGLSGFTTRGGASLMAWALIAMTALGAWTHNAIVTRGNREGSD